MGRGPSGPEHIRAVTPKSFLTFKKDTLTLGNLEPGQRVRLTDQFPFVIANQKYGNPDNENFITKISLEVSCNDSIHDISDIFIHPVSDTRQLTETSDLIILDGTDRTVKYYNNQLHKDTVLTISGGSGNGNSIPEPGETIDLWIKLPQGLGAEDRNTFHPAFLVNKYEVPWISVPKLKYNIKGAEWSGAANLQSEIKINPETPPGTELTLWLQCESNEFSDEGYNKPIQRHLFDYRRLLLRIGKSIHTF